MGTWGYGLYKNDTSQDVKDRFDELFQSARTATEITEVMLKEFAPVIEDPTEAPLFYLALADLQWSHGILQPSVKEAALFWIDNTPAPGDCQMGSGNPGTWAKTLDNLRSRLLSTPPAPKKPKQKRLYRCEWKTNDVFAYRLESDLARERGWFGRYFLIQKVDEDTWYPGHIIPIVYVKFTADANLPSNTEEYDRTEYVQTAFTKYESRFWPIDMRRPREDIAEKSKLTYTPDAYGFLPNYRLKLLNTSKRVIPKTLIYLGNFPEAARPRGEFIPFGNVNIHIASWKGHNGTFEEQLIRHYCNHNLRELSIYARNN